MFNQLFYQRQPVVVCKKLIEHFNVELSRNYNSSNSSSPNTLYPEIEVPSLYDLEMFNQVFYQRQLIENLNVEVSRNFKFCVESAGAAGVGGGGGLLQGRHFVRRLKPEKCTDLPVV